MIPEEMGIIGFANEEFDEYITPTISSIDQQTVQMGREAFNMLLELIENGEYKAAGVSKIVSGTNTLFQGIIAAKQV